MKETTFINKDLSELMAGMGHTDTLVVADAGLPIFPEVWRIDLALKRGVSGLLKTVETLLSELYVQEVIVATEMARASPQIEAGLRHLLLGVEWRVVPHPEFKALARYARGLPRAVDRELPSPGHSQVGYQALLPDYIPVIISVTPASSTR